MSSMFDKNRRLYGSNRAGVIRAKGIENVLKKTSVLQNGEYNFTNEKLKTDIWETSTGRDFQGQGIVQTLAKPSVSQIDHHFLLSYDTNPEEYQGSTTKADFNEKVPCKPCICVSDKTITWPHLEPYYTGRKPSKHTEYRDSFASTKHVICVPAYPKKNVSNLNLPLEQEHYHLKGSSHFQFGNDERSNISEQQRAYGRRADGNLSGQLAIETTEAKNVIKKMKTMDRTSHVFRRGDYNGHANNYISTNVGDFGPRTIPPSEIVASELIQEALMESSTDEPFTYNTLRNVPNELATYARTVTVPNVYRAANVGKKDSVQTHFKFGSYDEKVSSIYVNDFEPVPATKAKFYVTPSAGSLIQNLPGYSKFGTTSHQQDFMAGVKIQPVNGDQVNFEKTMAYGYTDNIIPTTDVHPQDRVKSLSHGDYREPPPTFKAMKPVKSPFPTINFFQGNDVLPYEGLPELSEAKNNFIGPINDGCHKFQKELRRDDEEYKTRKEDFLRTHFTVGNTDTDFLTESKNQFTGQKSNIVQVPPAGIVEKKPKVKFDICNISENQQDMRAGDPYTPSTKESLHSRYVYNRADDENPFTASVMKSDYRSLTERRLNEDHLKMLQKFEKLYQQPIARSHFFHTDNTGQNVYKSTTTDDFIKPETMTGQKLLGAR